MLCRSRSVSRTPTDRFLPRPGARRWHSDFVRTHLVSSVAAKTEKPLIKAGWQRDSEQLPDDVFLVQPLEGCSGLPGEPAAWVPWRVAPGVAVNVLSTKEAVHPEPVWREQSNPVCQA